MNLREDLEDCGDYLVCKVIVAVRLVGAQAKEVIHYSPLYGSQSVLSVLSAEVGADLAPIGFIIKRMLFPVVCLLLAFLSQCTSTLRDFLHLQIANTPC